MLAFVIKVTNFSIVTNVTTFTFVNKVTFTKVTNITMVTFVTKDVDGNMFAFVITVTNITTYSTIYPTRCKVTQFIYIWEPLYMFRVVPPPIIRSTYTCIYSIWYLLHCYCYLPLATGSGNRVTNTRCCIYSCTCS
jgi:hypothetical protein